MIGNCLYISNGGWCCVQVKIIVICCQYCCIVVFFYYVSGDEDCVQCYEDGLYYQNCQYWQCQ